MKLSELWLREWVNPAITREQLCALLTMAGLEVEEFAPVAEQFSGVVVGSVLQIEKHPEADKLQICLVDIGESEHRTIVCGAKNVKVGMKVPVALPGAILPNKTEITHSSIRGVASQGMLCSAVELGLSEQGEGLLQLSYDAKLGENIWEYLKLNDFVIDISITPNRGDCLSIKGLAKEIAALTQCLLHIPNILPVKPASQETLSVTVENPKACPRYTGRVIKNVRADVTTPMWLQERLRRGNVRCISPIVDVMNYVMLELGQPMHAFDLQKITEKMIVRPAHANEKITLLDGQVVSLTEATLVIADRDKPLAIAGVMGGLESGVTLLTKNIFLESAYFNPADIALTGRHFGLSSDSSYRFERGIDPTIQTLAIERATELLLEIVGGEAGPVIEVIHAEHLPSAKNIFLRKQRVSKILGFHLADQEIESILERLGFSCQITEEGWHVTVPPRRPDITLEVDLIEEIIRLHGYEKLPLHQSNSNMQIHPRPENIIYLSTLRRVLCDLGFNEIVSYSFIDKKTQALFDPDYIPKELTNPMSAEMAVMRTNLWPGLVNTLQYNQNRQQSRIRLFEVGLRFLPTLQGLEQQKVISGLISGTAFPEQWGIPNREVDFFDLKGDLQNIFRMTLAPHEFTFRAGQHPALHPGQTAEIYRGEKKVGIMGALHPLVAQKMDIQGLVLVFELQLDTLEAASLPHSREISKFPEIRRDIALLIDRTIPSQVIQDTIREVVGDLLMDINIFDVYQGKGISSDRKSIALALTLQHLSRTLRDEEVADVMERVIIALKDKFAAELRS